MSLGNRFSAKMAHSDALAKAWRIVKAGSVEISVAGVTFGNRQEALKRLARYRPSQIRAFLAPEPDNPKDKNAVAVMVGIQGGKGYYRLGYVPAYQTGMAKALGRSIPSIRVLPGDIYGARLRLAV
jgi:hypothetical protein